MDQSVESNQPQNRQNWSELPSLAIEKIYSFLNRQDQCRMSLVCRRWAKEYSSPAIWETVVFYLSEHDCLSDIYQEVKLAKKYGKMFKNVEIIRKRERVALREVIWIQLKLFLNILSTNSQLMSLKFVNLNSSGRFYRDITIWTSVFREIVQLLESQNNLRILAFHDSYFSFEEAVELLKTVSENSGNTLRKLTLRGFVDDNLAGYNPNIYAASNLCALMQENFVNLTTIDADYSQIFENMLPRIGDGTCTFETHNKLFLSKIILNCAGIKRTCFQGIPSMTWQYLRQSSLDLKVELYFRTGFHPKEEMEFFIVPGIPLTFLDFRFKGIHYNDSNINFGGLFTHLLSCKCHEHLESLYVGIWMRPISDVSSMLIPFLEACSRLKSFQLFIKQPINGEWNESEEMLKSWLENRPNPPKVLISVKYVRNGHCNPC